MKQRSSKAKGKRAVQQVRRLLLSHCPELEDQDIIKPIGSRSGADLILSETAREKYPFTIEVKNQEKLNIWESIEQSERHARETDLTALLVFRRNHSELYACLRLEDLLKLLGHKAPLNPQDLCSPEELHPASGGDLPVDGRLA